MVTVRPAAPSDREPLREIQRRAIAEPWTALLEAALEGPPPLYVLDDGTPVGYGVVIAGDADVAYVPELAVHPERQGEGLGSQLVSFLLSEFDGHGELRLTVRTVDERARAFYESHGFEPIERIGGHFEGCDGLLMRRSLDSP